jgi:hypothetical protein
LCSFFDDILIYSSSWSEHLRHINLVLAKLQEHHLFVKRSKCSFDECSVAYLGHVISTDNVSMDKQKAWVMLDWPLPCFVRTVRVFLGLAGYYRRFIKNYGAIATPLTALLKKDAFKWSAEVEEAFWVLQCALTMAPILQLSDFDCDFVVECDTSSTGLGAMLHQSGGQVAFLSRQLVPWHTKLITYERELIGLVHTVQHWRPCLLGHPFLIKTDHFSIKFLLDQCLATNPQHQWASKLIGFDFRIEF